MTAPDGPAPLLVTRPHDASQLTRPGASPSPQRRAAARNPEPPTLVPPEAVPGGRSSTIAPLLLPWPFPRHHTSSSPRMLQAQGWAAPSWGASSARNGVWTTSTRLDRPRQFRRQETSPVVTVGLFHLHRQPVERQQALTRIRRPGRCVGLGAAGAAQQVWCEIRASWRRSPGRHPSSSLSPEGEGVHRYARGALG